MCETTFEGVLDWLHGSADEGHRAGLSRYGIPVEAALGMPLGEMKRAAQGFSPACEIVFSLWDTGIYEARVMVIHLTDPDRPTRDEADLWCRDFDYRALCDTAAFQLFDRTPWRWGAAEEWTRNEKEYVRRAGLATLWALSVHDKAAKDAVFIAALNWTVAGDAGTRSGRQWTWRRGPSENGMPR